MIPTDGWRIGRCGPYSGPICDFHTHLNLRLVRTRDNTWHHGPDHRHPGPCSPWLERFVWGSYEASRYRYFIRRGSPFERPMERVLARVLRGTPLEHAHDLLGKMDAAGVARSVILAVPPVSLNEDISADCVGNPRLIPFGSPDCRRPIAPQVEAFRRQGIRGLKIHPVLQGQRLMGDVVLTVAAFARQQRLPLVFHAGGTGNLFRAGCSFRTEPEEFQHLAQHEPDLDFVVAHSGLWEWPDLLPRLAPFPRVMFDISFQCPAVIRRIVGTLGAERVLLGSDSPTGKVALVIENLAQAGLSERDLRLILWENSRRLLRENT